MAARSSSLADTELAENPPEQVLGGEFPGDLGQRRLREAQFLGGKLDGVAADDEGVRSVEARRGVIGGLKMAAAGRVGAARSLYLAGQRLQARP